VTQAAANFADRLLAAIEQKGSPVCVGIDPRYDRLPEALRAGADAGEAAKLQKLGEFCWQVLQAVAPHVPAVKPQSACFEAYGPRGVETYFQVVRWARELGLVVIGDVKRNDIGSTAEAYAAGHLAAPDAPDALTVNGYFGRDGLEPFFQVCRRQGKGVFVLVRTSNPSAREVQDFQGAAGKRLYEHVAELVASYGAGGGLVGRRGYSAVGAVVGATYPDEARVLRGIMPQQVFLVPGYGAQGAAAADCAAAFKPDGTGAIVNASRSVIYAFQQEPYAGMDWKRAVERAARAFADDIRNALT
jgi:orotidine-5'-phosphate decarboxylase